MHRPQFPNGFQYILLAAVAICITAMACAETLKEKEAMAQADIVGVWKLCYSPSLDKVTEVDGGYLILLPDGTFRRLNNDLLFPRLQSVETGTYEIKGRQIVFRPKDSQSLPKPNSKSFHPDTPPSYKEFVLTYEPTVEIVFFDNLKQRIKRPVLRWQEIDYSYGKIY
jgi:hypothetical protein